jgi:hypothetical protein
MRLGARAPARYGQRAAHWSKIPVSDSPANCAPRVLPAHLSARREMPMAIGRSNRRNLGQVGWRD